MRWIRRNVRLRTGLWIIINTEIRRSRLVHEEKRKMLQDECTPLHLQLTHRMLGMKRPPPYNPFLLPIEQSLALFVSTMKAPRRNDTLLSSASSECSVTCISSDVATNSEDELGGIRLSFADLFQEVHV